MNIAYITNADRFSGVGHRAYMLESLMRKRDDLSLNHFMLDGVRGALHNDRQLIREIRVWPGLLGSKSVNWVRLGSAFRKLVTTSKEQRFDVFHITNQSLSFLAGKLPGKTVVTVHDVIEMTSPQNAQAVLVNKYLYSGISRADHIVAVSEYTKQAIHEFYGIPNEEISVIQNAVDPAMYHPINNFADSIGYQELRRELKLADAHPVVLYVGSDHPRKNLVVALQAFAELQNGRPDAVFLKVGRAGLLAGRERTLQEMDKLNIRDAVRFVEDVDEEKLNQLYNLADVFIYPSKFEGFGLPPLQAMATGTPVVCSNATSLPEVVGDAALLHEPDDVSRFSESLRHLTENGDAASKYRQRGLERVKHFSWESAVDAVHGVYKKIASG